MRIRRRIALFAVTAAALLIPAGSAFGATATLIGTTLTVSAGANETNVINIRYDPIPSPDTWQITDTPAMTAGTGCALIGNDVKCDDDAPVTVTTLIVNLGNGNDSVTLDSVG